MAIEKLEFKRVSVSTLSCREGFRVEKVIDKPVDRPVKVMFEAWNKATLINTVESGDHARRLCQAAYEASRGK